MAINQRRVEHWANSSAGLKWRAVVHGISLCSLSKRQERAIVLLWIVAIVAIAVMKAVTAPTPAADFPEAVRMALPFLLVAAAPVAGFRMGRRLFMDRTDMRQPAVRLARYGSWRPATLEEVTQAREQPTGFVWFSLISGILLNVPVRAMEYLASIPAVAPGDAAWVHAISRMFTLDCATMCFVYAACFAAALGKSPFFPRLLVCAWLLDIAMQWLIATHVGAAGMPSSLIDPLASLLDTNVKKVGISATIWLPYLLVSETVNLRLRARVRLDRLAVAR